MEAGGNNAVPGGKENEVYAMTGWGRFVVSESYSGVKGGSPVGGAGSLWLCARCMSLLQVLRTVTESADGLTRHLRSGLVLQTRQPSRVHP